MIGYDSTKPRLIPADAEAIFPYADGIWAWSHKLFPNAGYRYITITGAPKADICDFEPGAVWPVQNVVKWATERRSLGLSDITVYTDRDNFDAVLDAMRATGITWHCWLTTLDGTKPTEYGGKLLRAVQYTDRAGQYDESVVYDTHWLNRG